MEALEVRKMSASQVSQGMAIMHPAQQNRAQQGATSPSRTADPLEAREFGKSMRRHVEEFGALFGAISFGVAWYILYTYRPYPLALLFFVLGAAFPACGYFLPRLLLPLRSAWMKFAHLLGTVVTFGILFGTWLGIVLPMALVLRLCSKKVMDLRFKAPVDSYWETRKPEKHDFQLLRRQF
jgi:hypothetical protein